MEVEAPSSKTFSIILGLSFVVYFFGLEVVIAIFGVYILVKRKWFSGSRLTKCPSDINVLVHESVYELYNPGGVPEVEIIFFHGLQLDHYQDAFWNTWLSRDGTVVWPKEWLSRTFPRARILAISYDSCARVTSTAGRGDMYILGENLLNQLVLNGNSNVGQSENCPVVLVGHSLGGLAIKQFILSSQKKRREMNSDILAHEIGRVDKFLSNLKGVFYYSTPHSGSKLADLASWVLPGRSPVLKILKTLNAETARINTEFAHYRENNRMLAWTVAESDRTKIWPCFKAVVVCEASARYDNDGVTVAPANHFNICKPESILSVTYQALEYFISHTVLRENATHEVGEVPPQMTYIGQRRKKARDRYIGCQFQVRSRNLLQMYILHGFWIIFPDKLATC